MAAAKRVLKKTANSAPPPDFDDLDNDELNEDPIEDLDENGAGSDDDNDDEPEVETVTLEPVVVVPVDDDPMTNRPRGGKTFRAGETVIFKGEEKGGFIVSLENIYRGSRAPGSSRWRYHLILGRGTPVVTAKTKKLADGDYSTDQSNLY